MSAPGFYSYTMKFIKLIHLKLILLAVICVWLVLLFGVGFTTAFDMINKPSDLSVLLGFTLLSFLVVAACMCVMLLYKRVEQEVINYKNEKDDEN